MIQRDEAARKIQIGMHSFLGYFGAEGPFMQFIPGTCGRLFRFCCLAVFVQLTIVAAVSQESPDGQQADAAAPEPPPPPAAFQNPIPGVQLAFLTGFDGHPVKDLMKDKRFKELMKDEIPRTEYHYGRDMGLNDALEYAMDGSPLPVEVRDGRFLMAAGQQGPYLSGRGFIWIDLQAGIFLGGFYFRPTNGEPSPTLTVFSRQLQQTDLSMSQLPEDFAQDMAQWALVSRVRSVGPRYFIPANGKKYALLHDEDYCVAGPSMPAPSLGQCQELNAEAADADMNAAYFMKETNNAANATAWMLGPDQVAWIGLRDQRCGNGLGCRIRFTRARTRVLTGHGGGAPHGRSR
jgi:uncharacterized protein YecT (DUF1311 family)